MYYSCYILLLYFTVRFHVTNCVLTFADKWFYNFLTRGKPVVARKLQKFH